MRSWCSTPGASEVADSWPPALAPLLAAAFSLWGSPVTWLEILAFGLSLAMVIGNLRVKVWAWPLAIAASACYGLLFAHSKLYGEASLQLFFIAISCWGWWQWSRGTDETGHVLQVRWMTPRQRLSTGAATALAWPMLAVLLARSTDSEVPVADALPTVASVAGQILLGRQYVENWLVWLGVNLFSIGLFAWKALWLTALLYALFAALSWVGWRTWQARAAAHA
ncbi:MAG: nicotinamide mononucleotide transporter [Rubrivivax sp.]|nr:nicotinamide mononucleotide transporter [Rubrivivax sp.]